MKHLIIDISSHGLGHLAQTALVINSLDTNKIRLTVRTKISEEILKERIQHPFDLIPYQQDIGMIMHDALQVDAKATMKWYQDFHATYTLRKKQAARDLETLKPDLVFADIPYLSLDACSLIDVPSIALCSLNWADIFQAYCGHFNGAAIIHDDIVNAYSKAQYFLQATPSMPMDNLSNLHAISPIAQKGEKQTTKLRNCVQKPDTTRFILVALGGIGMQYPLESWPQIDDVSWIFDDAALYLQREDFIAKSLIDLSYTDLLASCDVILTKTGYGTQTEAVVNRIPTLCVARGDWPEEPYLFEWHQRHGIVDFLHWQNIGTQNFRTQIECMLEQDWNQKTLNPTGAGEAAAIIHDLLYPLHPSRQSLPNQELAP
ncbi:MAG: Unknown protein [uncultured Thiotrichaceae bacterium]|uniref:Glycosyl transferase family 28 C-terminal domain-containing protein n=1 Tax=uncultured Thiotrichaceae bacterium TaxID=298394 RepID=A0A6S6U7D0_9GAMM|nr:MAG: Unknown protein [uncultured Thiotrichaceae bacterium]